MLTTRPAAELSQIELEQLARDRAERLLNPRQRADVNSPPPPPPRPAEPTIEQRFADIERRAAQFAAEQRRALLADALDNARRRFREAVENTTDEQVRTTHEAVQRCSVLAVTL